VIRETQNLISDVAAFEAMARAVNPFGDGHAAERIVTHLKGDVAS
jgi:UDP-N-acetylglucosamine 2-epimerase (non-hydrolysing)